MSANILEITALTKHFGGLTAVSALDLHIAKGEIMALIGPNGAGKSTVFNLVAGVYPPSDGVIRFKGEVINGRKPWNLCKLGLARTFQIVKPFASKTVLYNVMVGAFLHTNSTAKARERAEEVMAVLGLDSLRDRLAGSLTIADRKRLEIGKALATGPELLLLDEVMAGLRPTEVDDMIAVIKGLRDRGVTVFVIEHIMRAVMALSDRVAVIHFGQKIAEGTPEAVTKDENVIKAYLGGTMTLLSVEHIDVAYGDVQVINDLSLTVEEGEVVSIIGGNGAGKSTLLKTISGLMAPSAGSIFFRGEPIHNLPPERIVERGIVHVPEGRRLFSLMTVAENLLIGAYTPRAYKERGNTLRQVHALLPRLLEREGQMAMTLSGGEQQMVAIGRGLMALPGLLMLDEPSLGLAPILVKSIFDTLRKIADTGTTVLLVEQDVNHSLRLSDRGYVLEHGRVALAGEAAQLLENPHIKSAYLGI